LARAYAAGNNTDDALKALLAVTTVDLEHAAAYQLTATLASRQPNGLRAAASAYVLNGHPLLERDGCAGVDGPCPTRHDSPGWQALRYRPRANRYCAARRSSLPLLSLILLQTHWQAHELDLALPLAKGFHDRWRRPPLLVCA